MRLDPGRGGVVLLGRRAFGEEHRDLVPAFDHMDDLEAAGEAARVREEARHRPAAEVALAQRQARPAAVLLLFHAGREAREKGGEVAPAQGGVERADARGPRARTPQEVGRGGEKRAEARRDGQRASPGSVVPREPT